LKKELGRERVVSLAPRFSEVKEDVAPTGNRFNGLFEKPLKRLVQNPGILRDTSLKRGVNETAGSFYFGATVPPTGQSVLPMRFTVISKMRTGKKVAGGRSDSAAPGSD